jgi:hypothetical protein
VAAWTSGEDGDALLERARDALRQGAT